jgi:hypothetical protein
VNVVVRMAKPTDLAYITDVWVTQATRYVNMSMRSTKARCQYILGQSKVTVACLPDDQDAILGFAVLEGPRCHLVYVRSSARRLGVARAMFERMAR